MSQQTVSTTMAPEVIIEQVLGDLQVKGWERAEVVVKSDPSDTDLREQEDVVHLSCRSDCVVRLPHGATVKVNHVHGDARFKLLEDTLTIDEALGSLVLSSVGETQVESVHGELMAKNIQGSLTIERTFGNAMVRNVQGACRLAEVNGNLDLRSIEDTIEASAKGNARVRLGMMGGSRYEIQAEGNIHCRIPEDANAKLILTSRGREIKVKLPNLSRSIQEETVELEVGGGEAVMEISAGGAILLASQESGWADSEDVEVDSEDLNQQIAQQIEAQVEAMTRQMNEQLSQLSSAVSRAGLSAEETERIIQRARQSSERATSQAQERIRRAQEKLERKVEMTRKRAEQRAEAAERRAQAGRSRRSWNFEWNVPPPPPPPKEPVSEEERLMILRMLEQKKISLEEAEKLLEALEGRNG